MSHIAKLKGIIVLLFGLILLIAGCSQQNSSSSVDPDTGRHIIAGWSSPDSHGAWTKRSSSEGGIASCQECHGDDFSGGISNTTCFTCHGASAPHPPAPWRGGAITHSAADQSNAPVCGLCHLGNPPIPVYAPLPDGAQPGCFNNTLCHVTEPDCVVCHSNTQTITQGPSAGGTRDAVVGEFGLTWGHKKSVRGAVTKADCIVCHLEGNFTTQTNSALHGN